MYNWILCNLKIEGNLAIETSMTGGLYANWNKPDTEKTNTINTYDDSDS